MALSSPLAKALSSSSPYKDKIGLQLWTVRNQMKEDPKKTLQAVKAAGYHQVELMSVMDGGSAVAKMAKDQGLAVTSSFMNWETMHAGAQSKEADAILNECETLGLNYLVFGYIGRGHRETESHYQKAAAFMNALGKRCADLGIQLCYHNHSFEYEPLAKGQKRCGFDVLIDELEDPAVKFELDVFWAELGGWNALKTMARLKGRIAQLHLKDKRSGTDTIYDEGKVPVEAFKELGAGDIAMAPVIAAAAKQGVAQCHVEQDQSPDPIASIGKSMVHLNGLQ